MSIEEIIVNMMSEATKWGLPVTGITLNSKDWNTLCLNLGRACEHFGDSLKYRSPYGEIKINHD